MVSSLGATLGAAGAPGPPSPSSRREANGQRLAAIARVTTRAGYVAVTERLSGGGPPVVTVVHGSGVAMYALRGSGALPADREVASVPKGASPNAISIGCSLYTLENDGTYRFTPDMPVAFGAELFVSSLSHLGRLDGPLTIETTGHREIFTYRGRGGAFAVSFQVTVEGGVIRQIVESSTESASRASIVRIVFSDVGHPPAVAAPPAGRIARALRGPRLSSTVCAGR